MDSVTGMYIRVLAFAFIAPIPVVALKYLQSEWVIATTVICIIMYSILFIVVSDNPEKYTLARCTAYLLVLIAGALMLAGQSEYIVIVLALMPLIKLSLPKTKEDYIFD